MSTYKKADYHLSYDSHALLADMFAVDRRPVPTRLMFGPVGEPITYQTNSHATGEHSLSHSLISLSHHLPIESWEDTRDQSTREFHDKLANTPPVIHKSVKDRREYNLMEGPYGLWSWHSYVERVSVQTDELDEDGDPITNTIVSYPFAHSVELRLSPHAINYYKTIALNYRMRTLVNYGNLRTTTGLVSAVLEAIGQQMLTPPNYYRIILENLTNPRMADARSLTQHYDPSKLDRDPLRPNDPTPRKSRIDPNIEKLRRGWSFTNIYEDKRRRPYR